MSTTITTTKLGPGSYQTPDGHVIQRAWKDEGSYSGNEWHLFAPDGEYCQTYPTKRDALEAVRFNQAQAQAEAGR